MNSEKRIVYTVQGGVAVLVPADCGLTLEQIAEKDVPAGVPWRIVDVADIPNDRTFRAAWVASGDAIHIDIEKAKDVAHDARRSARAAEFAPLDIQATIPAMAASAEAKRQAVRDKYAEMQTAIDAALTVEEVKAAMP